jgi:excisionase family DNA binding protein
LNAPESKQQREESIKVENQVALSINEVAIRAGLSINTVRKHIASGDLTARRVGKRVLVTVPDVLRWLDGQPSARKAEAVS